MLQLTWGIIITSPQLLWWSHHSTPTRNSNFKLTTTHAMQKNNQRNQMTGFSTQDTQSTDNCPDTHNLRSRLWQAYRREVCMSTIMHHSLTPHRTTVAKQALMRVLGSVLSWASLLPLTTFTWTKASDDICAFTGDATAALSKHKERTNDVI